MKICIETNWDSSLPDLLADFPVTEFCGSISDNIIGTSYTDSPPAHTSRRDAEKHIQKVIDSGSRFNYILDSSCLGNMENEPEYRMRVKEYLIWLRDTGVSAVTVSNPFLIEYIKTVVPDMKKTISLHGEIDSIPRMQFFRKFGADELIVDPVKYRDFNFLARLAKHASCELSLIANQACLYQCAFRLFHSSCSSHMSREGSPADSVIARYSTSRCVLERLKDPSQLIRARWIRPEDLSVYEKTGYEKFIILSGGRSTRWILNTVSSYCSRSCSGNLQDILWYPSVNSGNKSKTDYLDYLYIDNTSFKGFIDFFMFHDCTSGCGNCSYCKDIAATSIKQRGTELAEKIDELIDSSSDFFKEAR